MNSLFLYVAVSIGSIAAGYTLFLGFLKALPRLEKRANLQQKQAVLEEAHRQRKTILADSKSQSNEHLDVWKEDLEQSIEEDKEAIQESEKELQLEQEELDRRTSRIDRKKSHIEQKKQTLTQLDQRFKETRQQYGNMQQDVQTSLAKHCEVNSAQKTNDIVEKIRTSRVLEGQKVLRSLMEELNASARKRAYRTLDRTYSRYNPEFVWPKNSNVVEISEEAQWSNIESHHEKLFQDISEIAEINVALLPRQNQGKNTGLIKVNGGYGVYREAARLTIEELMILPPRLWGRANSIYKKHRSRLESQAQHLGKEATSQLGLEDIHPEIQKLVGALNWRTSYRQNQWHHTVEVATLAGVIASELGVCPQSAKRVGLLHDIGKAIDYRIEGSHAVISGDYADRYGETRVICDTVMSHHADLIVESPLAYILRAADTLSGARPGARVNLEEGYQIRLDAINEAVRSVKGVAHHAIMNGGREVHVQVNEQHIPASELERIAKEVAKRIEEDVAYPGQIKVMVSRTFEAVSVA
ncbi:MAG: Rnase Y domain-containing protein [Zetaproteobacteria bacterium]|nr:Rnase Y domain-containing protein [Zetaproteobacteria bacterium]